MSRETYFYIRGCVQLKSVVKYVWLTRIRPLVENTYVMQSHNIESEDTCTYIVYYLFVVCGMDGMKLMYVDGFK